MDSDFDEEGDDFLSRCQLPPSSSMSGIADS